MLARLLCNHGKLLYVLLALCLTLCKTCTYSEIKTREACAILQKEVARSKTLDTNETRQWQDKPET
jgi:hypothetical protein